MPLAGDVKWKALLYFLLNCKAMAEVTVSSKNQIVIPLEARKALGLKAGDKLVVIARGDKVIVLQRPRDYPTAIRELAEDPYPGGYLRRERRSW